MNLIFCIESIKQIYFRLMFINEWMNALLTFINFFDIYLSYWSMLQSDDELD